LRFAAGPVSLSEPLREDGDAELGDVVEDRSAESPFEVAATALLPEEIARLLAPLDEREREILKLRFGLDRGEPRTLEEVGEHETVVAEEVTLLWHIYSPPIGGLFTRRLVIFSDYCREQG
jgi:DNA-directed RNA polymerase sigma subunit (sigma70/sigma32)